MDALRLPSEALRSRIRIRVLRFVESVPLGTYNIISTAGRDGSKVTLYWVPVGLTGGLARAKIASVEKTASWAKGRLAPKHAEHMMTPNKLKAPSGTGLTQTGTYSAFNVSGAIFV